MAGAAIEDGIAALRAMVAISNSVKEGKKIRLENTTGGV